MIGSIGSIGSKTSALDSCSVCQNDRYIDPSVVLSLSPCGHSLCKSCIDKLFTTGAKAMPCPAKDKQSTSESCGALIEQNVFVEQDGGRNEYRFGRENGVRKRLSKVFNKRREDFQDLRSYNDYLEAIEDIVFNLTNGIDMEKTEAKIAQYKRENEDLINRNIAKKAAERRAMSEVLAEERRQLEERVKSFQEEKANVEVQRQEEARQKEALLNGLAAGTVSVAQVRARQKKVSSDLKRPGARARRKDGESKPSASGSGTTRFDFSGSTRTNNPAPPANWGPHVGPYADALPNANTAVAQLLDGPFATAELRRATSEAISTTFCDPANPLQYPVSHVPWPDSLLLVRENS